MVDDEREERREMGDESVGGCMSSGAVSGELLRARVEGSVTAALLKEA